VQRLVLTISLEQDKVDEAGGQKEMAKLNNRFSFSFRSISPTSGCSQLGPGGKQATPTLSNGCFCVF
jgi:hypothetical protein